MQRLDALGRLEEARVGLEHALAADVARHDDDGVREVGRAPAPVGEAPVVEHLQEQVEDVGVRLLDLVEEEDAVRPAAHRLRQVAALLAVDVAGRRADEPRGHVLLHELAHVEARQRLLVVEEKLGERLRELGLADAARSEKEERPDRLARIAQSHAAAAHGARDGAHRFALPDDALGEALLHLEELVALGLEHLADGDAGPVAEDARDVFLGDHVRHVAAALATDRRLGGLEPPPHVRQLHVLELSEPREVLLVARLLHLGFEPVALRAERRESRHRAAARVELRAHLVHRRLEIAHLLLDALARLDAHRVGVVGQRRDLRLEGREPPDGFVDLCGDAVDLDALARGRFVEEIDRRVGQRAVLQVALREAHRGEDGPFADLHLVVRFVLRRDAAQDLDGRIDRGSLDRQHAETPEQAGVALLHLASVRRSSSTRGAAPRRASGAA